MVKARSPRERRHITILVHRFIVYAPQLLAQRGADVRIGAVVEQQPREHIVIPQANRLTHHTSSVITKALLVDLSSDVHVGAARDQPSGNVDFVVVDAEVEERRTRPVVLRGAQGNDRCGTRALVDRFRRE